MARPLVNQAVSFLRSPRGQQLLATARRRVDTPENRVKAQRLVQQLSAQARRGR